MEKIYLVVYTHKHGVDYTACVSWEKALQVGREWASERRKEFEKDDDYAELDKIQDPGEYIDKFNEIEAEWGMSMSGEDIEIKELPLVR